MHDRRTMELPWLGHSCVMDAHDRTMVMPRSCHGQAIDHAMAAHGGTMVNHELCLMQPW